MSTTATVPAAPVPATATTMLRPGPRAIVYDPNRRPSGQAVPPPSGRAKLVREACSTTWRDDLMANRDRDYLGRPTGPGTRKARCGQCGKACPPQYVVTGTDDAGDEATCLTCVENNRAPADRSRQQRPIATVPVFGLGGVQRVALERMTPDVRPSVTLERVGHGPGATYEPRPTGSLAVAMSPAHVHVLVDALPVGGAGLSADADDAERAAYEADEQALAAELASFSAAVLSGEPDVLVNWFAAAEEPDQAYRRGRYAELGREAAE